MEKNNTKHLTGTVKRRILLAPLDWGLGHATRCIPIVHELLRQNCDVVIAAAGRIESLLKAEFPELPFIFLPGYNVQYGKTKWETVGKLLWQIPKIRQAVNAENKWLHQLLEKENFDLVISDNRYGLHHDSTPSVFITHQLLIKTGMGKMADRVLQQMNYDFINQFTACWVPDVEEPNNLAGELSHPETLPEIPLHYIGPLSRFAVQQSVAQDQLLIILSGPEPQRTLLEEMIVKDLSAMELQAMIVRGLPGEKDLPETPSCIKMVNHLAAAEMEQAISKASLVISRCGYSTVMDLVTMKKKSILVPTPGQTEQEYLATHLMEKNMAFCIPQSKLKLNNALQLARQFNYNFPRFDDQALLSNIIAQCLQQLS